MPSVVAPKPREKVWKCDACGLTLHNVPLPVRHNCPRMKQFKNAVKRQKDRGLGDTLARVFAYFGVKKSKGCKCNKRQKWLNRVFPYST